MKLTESQEEYLKTIYLIEKNSEKVRVTDIAEKLKITKPSVNKAMKNLKEMELIEYQTYGNIKLTKDAEEIAKKVLKKQDIIEIFLKEILEVDESQAIEEAKAMKYAISEETEQKLDNYISKILNLGDLKCGYNSDNEKCRKCARITAKKKKIK
ncbi:MAG: metal-dependent transcriptional regulator [Clostridia bacterium]